MAALLPTELTDVVVLVGLLIFTMVVVYLSAGLVSHDWVMGSRGWVRIFVIALVVVVAVPLLSGGLRDVLPAGTRDLVLVFVFILVVLLVKVLLIGELIVTDEWLASLFIGLLVTVFIFVANWIVRVLLDVKLLEGFALLSHTLL